MEAPVTCFILLALTLNAFLRPGSSTGTENPRNHSLGRRLHEPLFPADPPPSPTQPVPSTSSQDSPLFSPGQPLNPTQTQTISLPTNISDRPRTQNESVKPAGKIFIAVSVSIVAVFLVLASACFIHYRRLWNLTESEKLVGRAGAAGHRRNDSGGRNQIPTTSLRAGSHFLSVGAGEPSRGRIDEMKSSPYHRLSESNNRLDYYRPSPELQPLPPLPRLVGERSPPTATSDEEGSYHTAKASLTGGNFSPHRVSVQWGYVNSTTTNTASTAGSSISTSSATNTSASFGKDNRATPVVGPSVKSPSTAIRLIAAGSPQLQPMGVSKQLPSSQSDVRTSFRSTTVSSTASLHAPSMPSSASPPLTPLQTLQTKMAEKFAPPLPPSSPLQALQTNGKIQSVSIPSPPPPPPLFQSVRTKITEKVKESSPFSPSPVQFSQEKIAQQTQSRTPPCPPPLPPPPPTPPQAPPPRPPSLESPLQHPVLNKNRLPDPCPPPLAACPQDPVETPAPEMPNNNIAEPVSSGPNPRTNLGQCSKKIAELEHDNGKPRLKPLHWDKVRARSDREMVWDRLKSSSFKLDEDMIETLFICNPANTVEKETLKKPVFHVFPKETRVLDPKKSQNIAILLRALNVTKEEICQALLEGNPEGLGSELLETIVKMAPTKEEELKLKEYSGDVSKLGSAERFLKDILDIPFAFKRIDALLYMVNFESEVQYLRKSFETLQVACEELRSSQLFLRLLEAVLKAGNRLNVGTNRGDAEAFKLDTLLKLVDIKGTDGKTTLLHFVVQEIIRSKGQENHSDTGEQHTTVNYEHAMNKTPPNIVEINFKKQDLRVVSGLSNGLANVKKAASMDSDVLNSYLTKLALGLDNISSFLQLEGTQRTKMYDNSQFSDSVKTFLEKAEAEILHLNAEQNAALTQVKEITEYFHGDMAKEEAHPFRIFVIVRDFLSILDKVCKEVGRIQERTIMNSAQSFRIPLSESLPTFPRFPRAQENSDDEILSPK